MAGTFTALGLLAILVGWLGFVFCARRRRRAQRERRHAAYEQQMTERARDMELGRAQRESFGNRASSFIPPENNGAGRGAFRTAPSPLAQGVTTAEPAPEPAKPEPAASGPGAAAGTAAQQQQQQPQVHDQDQYNQAYADQAYAYDQQQQQQMYAQHGQYAYGQHAAYAGHYDPQQQQQAYHDQAYGGFDAGDQAYGGYAVEYPPNTPAAAYGEEQGLRQQQQQQPMQRQQYGYGAYGSNQAMDQAGGYGQAR
jgi:hypothetical protein